MTIIPIHYFRLLMSLPMRIKHTAWIHLQTVMGSIYLREVQQVIPPQT